MKFGHLSGSAIDVFEKKPYIGPLKEIEKCLKIYNVNQIILNKDTESNLKILNIETSYIKKYKTLPGSSESFKMINLSDSRSVPD